MNASSQKTAARISERALIAALCELYYSAEGQKGKVRADDLTISKVRTNRAPFPRKDKDPPVYTVKISNGFPKIHILVDEIAVEYKIVNRGRKAVKVLRKLCELYLDHH